MCKEFCGKESDNNFQVMSFSKADKKIPEDEEIKLAHHLEFKRLDLLLKLNKVCGSTALPTRGDG